MRRLVVRVAPGVTLGAGVSLRSTADSPSTTGEAARLPAVQSAATSGATLLPVGGSAVRVLLAVLVGAPADDGSAGVVA